MKDKSVAIRDVEIRTWPQRTDLLIIDPYQAQVIAHFPCVEPAPGKVADLTCGYETRAQRALRQISCEQEYLKRHFGVEEEVQLRPISEIRELLEGLLQEHNLCLEEIELPQIRKTLEKMETFDTEELYTFLCDWHDIVELHLPGGTTAQDENAWVWRAQPAECGHFHYLATGVSKDEADTKDTEAAYALFRQLVDVPLRHFSFGHALRWVYFSKAEFPEHKPFSLKALQEAGY